MKRYFSLLLIASILFTMIGGVSFAQTTKTSKFLSGPNWYPDRYMASYETKGIAVTLAGLQAVTTFKLSPTDVAPVQYALIGQFSDIELNVLLFHESGSVVSILWNYQTDQVTLSTASSISALKVPGSAGKDISYTKVGKNELAASGSLVQFLMDR